MEDTTQAASVTNKKAKTEVKTVAMLDGRLVDFAGNRKLLKESKLNSDGTIAVVLDFVNGETRTFTLPQDLIAKFAAHGAEQKLGDEIAGLDDIDDCVMAMDNLIDRLYNGEWNVKRESNGMAGTSILAKAIIQMSGKKPDEVRAFLQTKSQAEKLALRNSPRIKPIVEELEAAKNARAKPKAQLDTAAMLDGFLTGNHVPDSATA